MVKFVPLPNGVVPITSRVVAEILDCSMGHVRNLALKERLKSWKIGARSTVFDLSDVTAYKKEMEKWRKEGHRGKTPGGFRTS